MNRHQNTTAPADGRPHIAVSPCPAGYRVELAVTQRERLILARELRLAVALAVAREDLRGLDIGDLDASPLTDA